MCSFDSYFMGLLENLNGSSMKSVPLYLVRSTDINNEHWY